MFEILKYSFMQKALLISLVLSIVMPLIGIVVVNKNTSVLGDALSHTSLVGVILGLIFGVSPVLSAIIVCIVASLLIEFLRVKFPGHSGLSTTIVMSASVGLASILSDFSNTAGNFESYLFGSIIAIENNELILVLISSAIVIFTSIYFYRELLYICFDENGARVFGINVDLVNTIIVVLTAVTVAISSRTIGVMIVSSMLVIPVACAIQLRLSYLKTIIASSLFGLVFMMGGLIISFYLKLKPGGTTIILATLTLLGIILVKQLKK